MQETTSNTTNMNMTIDMKDLTKEAARSPRDRIGGYAILARLIDKARADIAGKIGEYHTNCPLDHLLLDWKGVEYGIVRSMLAAGAPDEEIANYLDTHGLPRSREEILAWSESVEKATMHGDPEKGAWFDEECRKHGLDPAKTTTFEWLEADDRANYGG
jgi:hypothetical protein